MWLFLMEADDHDRGKNNGGGVAFSGGLLVFDAQWVTYCHLFFFFLLSSFKYRSI